MIQLFIDRIADLPNLKGLILYTVTGVALIWLFDYFRMQAKFYERMVQRAADDRDL